MTALFVVYLAGFTWSTLTKSPYNVVYDEVKVITKPAVIEEEQEDNVLPTTTNGKAKPLLGPDGEQLEELDVQETLILEDKGTRAVRSLLTGLPSPSSKGWTLASLLVNVVLMLFVLDYCYRAAIWYPSQDLAFARLGYVSDKTATVLVREPSEAQLPLYLSYRYADPPKAASASKFDGAWKHVSTVTSLTNATDYTVALTITGLRPDTRYQYAFSNAQQGFFITAPKMGQFSSRTALQDTFTFVHTSCVIPHFPYNPLHHPLHIPGFPYLAKWLKSIKPAFMLFLGDFIYIDVPLRHGVDAETYRRAYRQVYASPDWPLVTATSLDQSTESYDDFDIPWIHAYDDHEIQNDWAANTTGVFSAAFDPYTHYHVAANPPLHGQSSLPTTIKNPLSPSAVTYFSYTYGPASFFLLDCRRFRTTPAQPDSTMLGPAQLEAVLAWLRAPTPPGVRWRIIVSSVPFTKNWRVNAHDTWAGYLDERRALLEAMWDAQARPASPGHVILSGDRHEFAATAFPPPGATEAQRSRWPRERCTVHEFSCSPLNMFYLPVRTYAAAVDDVGRPVPDERDGLEDVELRYAPDGNHKFGAVSVRRETGSGQSVLEYRLFIGGEEVWSHLLVAPGGLAEADGLWG